jgi:hypothetical protein
MLIVKRNGISYAVVGWWGRSGASSGDSQGWVGDDAFLLQLLRVSFGLASKFDSRDATAGCTKRWNETRTASRTICFEKRRECATRLAAYLQPLA